MESDAEGRPTAVAIALDQKLFSSEAILKTCYWFSKEFDFETRRDSGGSVSVLLTPKQNSVAVGDVRSGFLAMAADFALRERIEERTHSVRELLLAKAFAEAGILEDAPEGVFGDPIEEAKPDGLFKILSNG